jgi:hypothetical protein
MAIEHAGEAAVHEALARYRRPDGTYYLDNVFGFIAAMV